MPTQLRHIIVREENPRLIRDVALEALLVMVDDLLSAQWINLVRIGGSFMVSSQNHAKSTGDVEELIG